MSDILLVDWWVNNFFNPLSPKIIIKILLTGLHRFYWLLLEGTCLNIKTIHLWWSLAKFSWPICVILHWYDEEKFDMYLLRFLIGSLGNLCLLWLAGVITLVVVTTLIWKAPHSGRKITTARSLALVLLYYALWFVKKLTPLSSKTKTSRGLTALICQLLMSFRCFFFSTRSDWFNVLFVSVVIGWSDYFGFDFTTEQILIECRK